MYNDHNGDTQPGRLDDEPYSSSSAYTSTRPPPQYSSRAPTQVGAQQSWHPSPYHSSSQTPPTDPSQTAASSGAMSHSQTRYKSALETRKQATLSAAIAAASGGAGGAAGLGANSNAYRTEPRSPAAADSPSQYTDPYEFQSTAPPPNVMSTRPLGQDYLHSDPYDRPLASGPADLSRADTLAPGDSISSYNVRIGGSDDDGAAPRTHGDAGTDYEEMRNRSSATQVAGASYGGGKHADFDGHDYYDSGYDHRAYDSSTTALPLKHHAGQMGYAEDEEDEEHQLKRGPEPLFSNQIHHPGMADEEAKSGLLSRFAGSGPRSADEKLHQQIERRRQGIGRQRWPFVSYAMGVALVAVFIVELIKAKAVTGQAIQTKPSINPMIGPSSEFLISFGARFVPCMRDITKLPVTTELPCLNATASASGTYTQDQLCPLWQTCGLADANSPNQGYRFISAIFLHAGFVHILFNLLVLLTLCAQIEKLIGSIPYTLIYFAGGVGGNLLGGNFGLIGQPALGASGAIYTCISVELVDLIYNWQYEYRARTRLVMTIIFTIVGLALGLLPGIDNFSHIGGFCVGILGGLLFAPAIHPTRRHRVICWILRVVSLGLLVGFFVGLAVNFYNSADPLTACTWCRYLSCLPVFNSCKGDGLTTSTSTTTTTTTSPTGSAAAPQWSSPA